MKWWQLTWLMNERPEYISELLAAPEWAKYRQWWHDRELHIDTQCREILDAALPDKLCREALRGCCWRYVVEDGYLKGGYRDDNTMATAIMLDAVQVYARFGGDAAVDAIEKGTVAVGSVKR